MKTLILVLLLLYAVGRAIRFYRGAQTLHDEVHYARTDDGALLAMYRYLPAHPDPARLPVILCHGYTETRFGFDLAGRSMPRYLADRGHEAWVVELRGQGDSRRAAGGAPFSWDFTFDDHARRDLPAAIELVLAKTGAPRVHWIGHSMGGMVAYAYLAWKGEEPRLARVATLGSPGTFGGFRDPLIWIVEIERFLRWRPILPTGFLLTLGLPLAALRLLRLKFIANPANLRGRMYVTFLANALADVGMRVSSQFAHFLRTASFTALSDGFDYEANYGRITTPMLLISGGRDTLVRTFRVRRVFDAIASPEKRYVRMGTRDGFAIDYGHGDLTVGDHAPREVWPLVADWLEAGEGRG